MNYLVMLFGAATMAAGVLIVLNPETLFGPLRRHYESFGMHVVAVAARLVLGTALVMCAPASNYPKVIIIIGWITLVAAFALGIMGRTNFKRLIGWALGLPKTFMRLGGLLAALFGGFLVHAVV
jgi:hypothetical protein